MIKHNYNPEQDLFGLVDKEGLLYNPDLSVGPCLFATIEEAETLMSRFPELHIVAVILKFHDLTEDEIKDYHAARLAKLENEAKLQNAAKANEFRLSFDIGQSGQRLVILPEVLEILAQHQQQNQDLEAGGQLFGRFEEIDNKSSKTTITIVNATGPRPTDIRTRYSFQPDRKAEQAEIDDAHRRGLFFLGDWHTHPESVPYPSPQDLDSIVESFKKSTHNLNGFLLVIAGTQRLPLGLYIAIHNDKEVVRLLPRELDNEVKANMTDLMTSSTAASEH